MGSSAEPHPVVRVYIGAFLTLAVLAAGTWRVLVVCEEGKANARRWRRLEDQNNMRQIVGLAAFCEKLPMKDGAFDPYYFVREGDITGSNIKLFRSGRLENGPTEEEAKDGDYTNFPWQRYRGERRPRSATPHPLLWEKEPDDDGCVLVALSDGTTYVWDRETLERALAEAGIGR
jgi:hypothetical protein